MASACLWTRAAKRGSNSFSVLALKTWSCTPLAPAAACVCCTVGSALGLLGFTSRPITLAGGTSSDISSSRFGVSSNVRLLIPVRLPPGRARLVTRPRSTGAALEKTIGIVTVAFFAARAQPGAQEFEFAPRPFELMGMAVPADHDRRTLGHPPIALAQRHALALGKIDQLRQRAMAQPRIGRMRDRLWLHRGVDHHAFEIPGCQCPGLVRHRQALLNQGDEVILPEPLPPMRQRRALKRQFVTEAH